MFWQALETRVDVYETPRQTSIDKTNDCLIISDWSELVSVSDLPQSYSIPTSVGDMWRRLTTRLINTFLALICKRQTTENIDPSPMARKIPVSGLTYEVDRQTQRLRREL